jgi:cysteine desulfurase
VKSDRIYLDHAASTPMRAEVAEEMARAAAKANYNPSSLHAEGRGAAALLEAARERIATALGAARNEITFTSNGTESDNLALLGAARASGRVGHIVAAEFEHQAVLSTLDRMRSEGFDVTLLAVDRDGRVGVDRFAAALQPDTVLASVMYANNEIGTVQPIAELASIARERNVLFHTDAVAAPCWLPMDVRTLGVDLLSLSAHKFRGPVGAGLLYARRGTGLESILYGGGQEFGRRPGTPNVGAIHAMASALELALSERVESRRQVAALRDRLENGIAASIPNIRVNGSEPRLPNVLNVSFAGADSDSLLIALDLAGVAASAGSACCSGSPQASHVIAAMGLEACWQRSAIRFSLGSTTTSAEIERVLQVLPAVVGAARRSAESATVTAGGFQGDG